MNGKIDNSSSKVKTIDLTIQIPVKLSCQKAAVRAEPLQMTTAATLQHVLLIITAALLSTSNAFQVQLSTISKFRRTNDVNINHLPRRDVMLNNVRPSQSDDEPNDQQLVSTNCTYPVRPACISGRIIYTLC
jgi:hypothetical protein